MDEFFKALVDTETSFLRNALLLGIIGSIPLGTVGTFVVARRISYLTAAIAHSILGGIGAALFAQRVLGWAWFNPTVGALLAALASAVLIGWVSLQSRQREDAVIGAIWVSGMALGLLFFSRTPGYIDPMAYLFGDILLIRTSDLWLAAGIGLFILVFVGIAHQQIIAVCFDPEFATIRGIRSNCIYMLLLILSALTIVALVSLIGIVLVVALLTLPPIIASLASSNLPRLLFTSTALIAISIFFGLLLSFSFNLPTGPSTILLMSTAYLIAGGAKKLRKGSQT
jgi:zinc transport system permease protein